MAVEVSSFFHSATRSYAHLLRDPATDAAAIVDPVLDFDAPSGKVDTLFADAIVAHVHDRKLRVAWILETHAHADHLSAGAYLRDALGAKLAIGEGIRATQRHFSGVFGLSGALEPGPDSFDRLWRDGERFALGALEAEVIATPGHTADAAAYRIDDAVFVGDTLFAPDVGTARCDFPGGSARVLHASIAKLLALPPATRVFLCHDYPPAGREPRPDTTIAAQRAHNIHVAGKTLEEYVALRTTRDATLPVPQLLYPALQVNIRGGRLPPADASGARCLRLPLQLAGGLRESGDEP
jgi:glyoxylase-like metal-dependent hydrolase (beta-lactamase superfamily II)